MDFGINEQRGQKFASMVGKKSQKPIRACSFIMDFRVGQRKSITNFHKVLIKINKPFLCGEVL